MFGRVCGAALLLGTACLGQDRRQVEEPKLRPVCINLQAGLPASGDTASAQVDTERIQAAIDRCSPEQAVELTANGDKRSFVSGPLWLKSGVALQIEKGVVLLASLNPRDYDTSPGSCGILSAAGHGCQALINGNGISHAAVMGLGTIDGRGGERFGGGDLSWWQLADKARNTPLNQNCPRLMQLVRCDDFALYGVTLRNSPNFHVFYSKGNGFTAWGVKIFSPEKARNTDGIDPSSSQNITITRCFIHTGDDQVAVKAGSDGPAKNITVAHNHFYTGHGISIGSETVGGVEHVRVSDLTIDGADNGIRIKSNASRGGVVEYVQYDDVCIRDTKVPIVMDSRYSFFGAQRDSLPTFREISMRDASIQGGGNVVLDGYDETHRLEMKLDNVQVQGALSSVTADHGAIRVGPGAVELTIHGQDVQVSGTPGAARPIACVNRFVPFPVSSDQR